MRLLHTLGASGPHVDVESEIKRLKLYHFLYCVREDLKVRSVRKVYHITHNIQKTQPQILRVRSSVGHGLRHPYHFICYGQMSLSSTNIN